MQAGVEFIGAEDTFLEGLTTPQQMKEELEKIAVVVSRRLTAKGLKGKTIILKIKYHNFRIITQSKSFTAPTSDCALIASTAKNLLAATELEGAKILLLGITVSNFGDKTTNQFIVSSQLPLYDACIMVSLHLFYARGQYQHFNALSSLQKDNCFSVTFSTPKAGLV